MSAVAVPRLLVNGNRTGGAAAAEVHTGDSPSCNRPFCTTSRLGCEDRNRERQREKSSNSKKARYVDNFLHVSYAETSVHTAK